MEKILPAITLYQPWATWVADELKLIETRTHNRFGCLLGKTILIHAGQTTDKYALPNLYLSGREFSEPVNGVILCKAFVNRVGKLSGIHSEKAMIDCETVERFGLYITNVEKFNIPIPVKGEMGIWYFDLERMQKVKKPQVKSDQLLING
jgi:hypothetical protein